MSGTQGSQPRISGFSRTELDSYLAGEASPEARESIEQAMTDDSVLSDFIAAQRRHHAPWSADELFADPARRFRFQPSWVSGLGALAAVLLLSFVTLRGAGDEPSRVRGRGVTSAGVLQVRGGEARPVAGVSEIREGGTFAVQLTVTAPTEVTFFSGPTAEARSVIWQGKVEPGVFITGSAKKEGGTRYWVASRVAKRPETVLEIQ